jgi:hypothetical protein
MKQFAEHLYETLLQEIEIVEEEPCLSPASRRSKILDLLQQGMEQLKAKVLEEGFPSPAEEITFFKHHKPRIVGLLIYYARLDLLELNKPEGSTQDLKSYYEKELESIRRFFDHNLAFYQYYRSEATYLDEKLFLRGRQDFGGRVHLMAVNADERFSTAADHLFARIQAHERLKSFLQNALLSNDSPRIGEVGSGLPAKKGKELRWTGEAINLVEIAYGWHHTGQLNHGQAGIGEIVRWLEEHLHISIGRPYRRFTEIKRRKLLSQTRFLDQMRDAILRKLDEEEAFDPRLLGRTQSRG